MTLISVSNQFEGLHQWPGAPDDVAFLRNLHRHLFKVTCSFKVNHADRQLEFFQTQRKAEAAIKELRQQLAADPRMSCEMMAEFLFMKLLTAFDLRAAFVQVSEDGENSAIYFNTSEDLNEQAK